jgi:hypothetical protein
VPGEERRNGGCAPCHVAWCAPRAAPGGSGMGGATPLPRRRSNGPTRHV